MAGTGERPSLVSSFPALSNDAPTKAPQNHEADSVLFKPLGLGIFIVFQCDNELKCQHVCFPDSFLKMAFCS